MELSQEEKDRIVAEEKLRMETRKEFFKDHFGGMGWRGGWGHYGYGHCHRGFGFMKGLLIAAVIFGIFHFWHHPCYAPYYGYACPPAAAQAPMPPTPPKN